jgi:probable HAF family extracellular repeat protein
MINLFQGSRRDLISSRRSSKSLVIPAVVESLEFRRLFSVEYSITDLGTLGGSDSSANAINASGQVVGTADNASGVSEAFIDTDGVMTNLGILPGGTGSNALAINASGEVVGEAVTSSGATNAVEFTGGNVVDLGTDGLSGSAAEGINDAGTIVGGLIITTNQLSPFIYSNGTFTILPTPAVINENSLGLAAGINDAGQIVGNYGNSFEQDGTPTIDEPYPYSWNASQQGGIAPLVPGYDEGLILAINSTGQGAGFGEKPSGRFEYL